MWSTIVLSLLLLAFGVVLVTYLMKGTPAQDTRVIGKDGERQAIRHPRFRDTFSILTNTTFHDGNEVEVLFNGDNVYDRLWEDLASAEALITWHVFWFKPGVLAERLAEILTERARAGVRVLFLYDYYGSGGVPQEYYDRLRSAGVEVACFRPAKWNTLYKTQHRMHVRAVVIDGRLGYTGGFAISDEWTGDGRHPDQWRDTSLRVRGPGVNQLQAAFASNWVEATGQLLVGDGVFPLDDDGARPGDVEAGVMYHAPGHGSTNAERFFLLTIEGARERLYITTAYFVPDKYFRRRLVEAAKRGVDVRVLTPGGNTDQPSTYHAIRGYYQQLIEGGVRIYHYRPTMVHAKTLVADGIWSAVGTINFDNRSMALNDEVAMVIRDEGIASRLEAEFLDDLEYADEVSLEELRERGLGDRIRERFYGVFSPLL